MNSIDYGFLRIAANTHSRSDTLLLTCEDAYHPNLILVIILLNDKPNVLNAVVAV